MCPQEIQWIIKIFHFECATLTLKDAARLFDYHDKQQKEDVETQSGEWVTSGANQTTTDHIYFDGNDDCQELFAPPTLDCEF